MLVLFLSLFLSHAWASCDGDFRPRLGPAHTQNDTGTCYAHAVADALTLASGKRVAPLSVETRYYQTRGLAEETGADLLGIIRGRYHGGTPQTAFEGARHKAVCTEAEVGSTDATWNKDLKRLWALHDRYAETNDFAQARSQVGEICSSIQGIFPKAQIKNLRDVLNSTQDVYGALGRVLDQNCHELKGAFNRYHVVGGHFQGGDAVIRTIDDAFASGALPVIEMDSSFFLKKMPVLMAIPNHAASIAARREVDGQCQYFLRTSWGSNCDAFQLERGAPPVRPPPWLRERCEGGGFWMSAGEIRTFTTGVSYLKAD
jgi:hypothetical protein